MSVVKKLKIEPLQEVKIATMIPQLASGFSIQYLAMVDKRKRFFVKAAFCNGEERTAMVSKAQLAAALRTSSFGTLMPLSHLSATSLVQTQYTSHGQSERVFAFVYTVNCDGVYSPRLAVVLVADFRAAVKQLKKK